MMLMTMKMTTVMVMIVSGLLKGVGGRGKDPVRIAKIMKEKKRYGTR